MALKTGCGRPLHAGEEVQLRGSTRLREVIARSQILGQYQLPRIG